MYTPNYQTGSPNNATSPYVEPFSGGNWNNTATNVGNQLKNGEILLSKNSDVLQVSLKVAEGHGEVDWCAVGKGAASLILGMYVQTNAYSDNAIEWWSNEFGLGKYADALIGLAASSLVERFLDPEMYYTGKYLVDAYIYAKTYSAGKFMQTLNNIFSGEDTGFDQTASLGLTSYLLYSATETTTTGTLITVGGETIVGAATVSATATGVVVVLAGALILTIQASTNGASQESMQENKDKADSYKGDYETTKKPTSQNQMQNQS